MSGQENSGRRIYVEDEFYENIEALCAEFAEKLSSTAKTNAGLTPLVYVYSADQYQLLTANGEQIFTRAVLDDLIGKISSWSAGRLGTFHVSTPQVRVFISGCKRELVQDSIKAQWHYVLSLTRHWPRNTWLKVLASASPQSSVGVGQVTKSKLALNQFVVHNVMDAYAMDVSIATMNPAEAIILLDGYLW